MFEKSATAKAVINGSEKYPQIDGVMYLYQSDDGVLVSVEVTGLPQNKGACLPSVFALHIHDGTECTGNAADPFAASMGHFNPNGCTHPNHAGDLPPLFGANGRAVSLFLTDRFTVDEVMGKTVIIHAMPDDFMSQPSGNSGEKIACGVIAEESRTRG